MDGRYRVYITLENLSFGFLIDVRYGGDVYLQSMMRLQSNGQTKETVAGREEYYTTGKGLISQGVNVNTGLPNTVELDPTTYWGQFYGNIGNYIYDTTNVRLRELNLTWTLPDKWFAKPLSEVSSSVPWLTMYASCIIIFRDLTLNVHTLLVTDRV